jgi:hypothetical protein
MRPALVLAALAFVLLPALAIAAAGCGTALSSSNASTTTIAPPLTSTVLAPSSTISTSAESSTTSVAQAANLDTLAPDEVVRTFFTSKDAAIRYVLMFQSTENLDPSTGRGGAEPISISNLIVTGPLAGVPFADPTRPDWKERFLFGVSYHLDSATPYGESPGPKELCVVVARQDAQSPWKILEVNQGPPPKDLPADRRDTLDKLSLADVVRTYFECFDFDTQVYLSAPRNQESLVTAMCDPAQKGDLTDFAVGTVYAGSSSVYSKEDWPIQRELTVTYNLLVARDYGPGRPNPDSPGKQLRFVIVGEQEEGGPWKILEVGTGP